MPIKIRYPVFGPCFLNFAALMMPTTEDTMLGMGTKIEPIIDINENTEYIVPLLVVNSKIQAIPKAITRPTSTSNGIPTHNNAVIFFFIKSPQNKRCATIMIAHLCRVFNQILLKIAVEQSLKSFAVAGFAVS